MVITVITTSIFPATMEECPVCLEPFGLDEHIPKSLDCRHAVCTECVMNPREQPLQLCPICRRDIGKRSTLPNDLTLISYMEKKKRKKYLKQQKEKIQGLIKQVLEASHLVDQRLEEEKAHAAEAVEGRSTKFTLFTRDLFQKCEQLCNSKHFLNDVVTQKRKELEDTRKGLDKCIAACTSLLDNPHVTSEEIDRCESDIQEAVDKATDRETDAANEEAMWNSYRQLVMETLAEISKVAPSNVRSFDPGKHLYLVSKDHVQLICIKKKTYISIHNMLPLGKWMLTRLTRKCFI